ncbi:MAG: 50S ribosomal protein L4 [Candidatus Omnitrophota bacterium]|nr:50S ribosomal protein L4 [Candidatus Omnitrophota bacterium]
MISSATIYDLKGKQTGKVDLDERVFNGRVNQPLLKQAMMIYARNKRGGYASTKTRKDVRGGGSRPWRQKGTGRARASTIRSPLWKGGGVIFGPHPRDYSCKLSKKMKSLALISALNSKLQSKQIIVVKEITISKPKTKEVASILLKLKALDKPLVIVDNLDSVLIRSARNIFGLAIKSPADLNTYDLIRHHKLVITEQALKAVTDRLLKKQQMNTDKKGRES